MPCLETCLKTWEEGEIGSAYSNFTEIDNLTCAARNIQGPVMLPYSSALTTTVRVLQGVFALLVILVGSFLNTAVIVLVAKFKELQTLSFVIALQVVILDLMIGFMLVIEVVTSIASEWLFGEYMCAFSGMLLNTITLVRICLMFVFVIDRYLSVNWTFSYPKYKVKIASTLSVLSWVFSILANAVMLPGLLDCYTFSSTGLLCSISSQCSQTCSIYIRVYFIVTVPLILVPIFLYGQLYYKGRKIRKESIAVPAIANQKSELKAMVTFSLLFLTVLVLTLPNYTILSIIAAVFPSGEFSPVAYVVVVVNLSLVSLFTITDPIVIMRNEDVRMILSEIKDVVMRKKPKKRPNQVNRDLTVPCRV